MENYNFTTTIVCNNCNNKPGSIIYYCFNNNCGAMVCTCFGDVCFLCEKIFCKNCSNYEEYLVKICDSCLEMPILRHDESAYEPISIIEDPVYDDICPVHGNERNGTVCCQCLTEQFEEIVSDGKY